MSKRKNTKNQKSKNYLDLVPVRNELYEWKLDENQQVIINRPNNKRMEKVTQFLFHTPKVTTIRLEEFGDFIWPLIDGQRTIFDIAQLVDEHFGEKAAPLYDRLIKYMENMKYHKFITFRD